ncbi:MAG: hypothetical protein KatS3mg002_1043 [Candidatus Woesearchaeota archaeon]|jgi:Holliday junction resolvasome RuvABC endonuclease subunit|nr:MAG: hypothetical protein KatS3mg002_1043 [Candidatus Woesearchaeota archaeon]
MKIIGIDLSLSNTGISYFENKKLCDVFSIDTKKIKKDQFCRMFYLTDKIKNYIFEKNPDIIVFESGFYRYNTSTEVLYRLQGMLFYNIKEYNFIFYSPSTIKKIITGKGNSKKEEVYRIIKNKFPEIEINNLDESDAIAIGLTFIKDRDIK